MADLGRWVMETFTVRLPRWPVLLRLTGRNPLVRTVDRIEALVLVLAVVVALLAVPIAAAAGTAIYDSGRHIYAKQANTRHTVAATVVDGDAVQPLSRTSTTAVPARWIAANTEHTGMIEAPSTIRTGETVTIWVDTTGEQVNEPTPASRAAVEAAMSAMVIWIFVAAMAAALFAVTRSACDRLRFTRWKHDLELLVGNGDDYQHPGRRSER